VNHRSVFFGSFSAGLAAPVSLFTTSSAPYWSYVGRHSVAQSFATVGLAWTQASSSFDNGSITQRRGAFFPAQQPPTGRPPRRRKRIGADAIGGSGAGAAIWSTPCRNTVNASRHSSVDSTANDMARTIPTGDFPGDGRHTHHLTEFPTSLLIRPRTISDRSNTCSGDLLSSSGLYRIDTGAPSVLSSPAVSPRPAARPCRRWIGSRHLAVFLTLAR
jgi:hypothetical protein